MQFDSVPLGLVWTVVPLRSISTDSAKLSFFQIAAAVVFDFLIVNLTCSIEGRVGRGGWGVCLRLIAPSIVLLQSSVKKGGKFLWAYGANSCIEIRLFMVFSRLIRDWTYIKLNSSTHVPTHLLKQLDWNVYYTELSSIYNCKENSWSVATCTCITPNGAHISPNSSVTWSWITCTLYICM